MTNNSYLSVEIRKSFEIWNAALLVHQILCNIERTRHNGEFQHLRGNLNSIGQLLAPIRRCLWRLDEQAHEGQIPAPNRNLDRERALATRRRTVLEQEAHDGHGPGKHGAHERVAVVRLDVGTHDQRVCARRHGRGRVAVEEAEERERFGAGWA